MRQWRLVNRQPTLPSSVATLTIFGETYPYALQFLLWVGLPLLSNSKVVKEVLLCAVA